MTAFSMPGSPGWAKRGVWRVALLMGVAQSAAAALEQAHHLAMLGDIAQELSRFGIIDRRSARHLNGAVLAVTTG